jgi:hypothetical protein
VVGGLATPVRAIHAVIAYALWAMLVWLSVHAGCWSMVGRGAAVPARTRVGGAARAS